MGLKRLKRADLLVHHCDEDECVILMGEHERIMLLDDVYVEPRDDGDNFLRDWIRTWIIINALLPFIRGNH